MITDDIQIVHDTALTSNAEYDGLDNTVHCTV